MVAIPTLVGVAVAVGMVVVTVVLLYYAFVVSAQQGIGAAGHEPTPAGDGSVE